MSFTIHRCWCFWKSNSNEMLFSWQASYGLYSERNAWELVLAVRLTMHIDFNSQNHNTETYNTNTNTKSTSYYFPRLLSSIRVNTEFIIFRSLRATAPYLLSHISLLLQPSFVPVLPSQSLCIIICVCLFAEEWKKRSQSQWKWECEEKDAKS